MWIVTKYKKRGDDALVDEYPLRARLSTLKRLFDAPGDEALALSYPIREAQRPRIEELLGAELDFRKYDYFLESVAPVASLANGRGHTPAASRRVRG